MYICTEEKEHATVWIVYETKRNIHGHLPEVWS